MTISQQQLDSLRRNALHFAAQHEVCLLLDNNGKRNACDLHDLSFVMAAGANAEASCRPGDGFAAIHDFVDRKKHTFGFFTYDMKNEVEKLTSSHPDGQGFPQAFFFEPQQLIIIDKNLSATEGAELMGRLPCAIPGCGDHVKVRMQPRVSREQYLDDVNAIRRHIIDGDVYELNYCVEFYAENVSLDPVALYERFVAAAPAPFGAFVKVGSNYLLCASPERFLKKKGDTLYSQPIKGTRPRGKTEAEDEVLRMELPASEKERAENLMIVDLVRNDLARSSHTGSVKVDELFGIYTFSHVHQMISTVSSRIRPDVHPVDAIRHAFPMGSMTGAPKVMAVQLIEEYERTKRGLYSGALGYFTPDGDFDFNVVIRSIQYNAATGYLSFEVGSAITFDSDPEEEFEECMVKARAMMEVVGHFD